MSSIVEIFLLTQLFNFHFRSLSHFAFNHSRIQLSILQFKQFLIPQFSSEGVMETITNWSKLVVVRSTDQKGFSYIKNSILCLVYLLFHLTSSIFQFYQSFELQHFIEISQVYSHESTDAILVQQSLKPN